MEKALWICKCSLRILIDTIQGEVGCAIYEERELEKFSIEIVFLHSASKYLNHQNIKSKTRIITYGMI